jgi:hypothetical protein
MAELLKTIFNYNHIQAFCQVFFSEKEWVKGSVNMYQSGQDYEEDAADKCKERKGSPFQSRFFMQFGHKVTGSDIDKPAGYQGYDGNRETFNGIREAVADNGSQNAGGC